MGGRCVSAFIRCVLAGAYLPLYVVWWLHAWLRLSYCTILLLYDSWSLDVFCLDIPCQVEGLNIPMSVGPPSVDKDNAGQECIVYDVIINPKAGIIS